MKLSETANPDGRWYLCEENNCMEMKIETLLAIMAKWNIIVAAYSEREQRYGDNPSRSYFHRCVEPWVMLGNTRHASELPFSQGN